MLYWTNYDELHIGSSTKVCDHFVQPESLCQCNHGTSASHTYIDVVDTQGVRQRSDNRHNNVKKVKNDFMELSENK